MSSSEIDSESDSDVSNADDFFDIFSETGGNGFAFEPEYSAVEVEERLRAHSEASEVEISSDEDAVSTGLANDRVTPFELSPSSYALFELSPL